MKNKIICFIFLALIFSSSAYSQTDCPTLSISIGNKPIESYDNSININDKITISITNTKNRFRITKVKIKLFTPTPEAGKQNNSDIQVKGFASKFSDNPVIEIPINKLITGDTKIEKIVLSILEITDESTDSQSDCFFYGQEYSFWVGG